MSKNDFFSDPLWPSLDIGDYLDKNNAQVDEELNIVSELQAIKDDLEPREPF